MANLSTTYLGKQLKNPIIIGASNLTTENSNLKQLEDAGAAAIVYKSLFEEQINLEQALMHDELTEYNERNAEMTSLFPNIEHSGPQEHLNNLRKAKEAVSIPLYASLNCIYKETWVEYAKLIEQTGVDGLELNIYTSPKDFETDGATVEQRRLDIIKEIKKTVKIPISVKLSFLYSNPLNFIKKVDEIGVNAVVLFNRFYQPDINIADKTHVSSHNLSHTEENKIPMRYAGLLFNYIKANICANSGIYEGTDVAKMLLAGADCTQVVSTVYKNKISHISKMLKELEIWMDANNFKTIGDYKGLLSKKNTKDPYVYQRAQYIDLILKSTEMFNKYALR
jgi:dihydroorotate dehydrogenase (fumarate)